MKNNLLTHNYKDPIGKCYYLSMPKMGRVLYRKHKYSYNSFKDVNYKFWSVSILEYEE